MPVEHMSAKIFNSGERDSAVEHILHMGRLPFSRFKDDVVPNGGVDKRLTYFLMTKHQRRVCDEERRIVSENAYLMEKMFGADNFGQRKKKNISLLPDERDLNVLALASNLCGRAKEARRIESANGVILNAMINVKPSYPNRKIDESHRKHLATLQRLSKFRPAEHFAGQTLLRKEFGVGYAADPDDTGGGAGAGASEEQQQRPCRPKHEWAAPSPQDVRNAIKLRDLVFRYPGGARAIAQGQQQGSPPDSPREFIGKQQQEIDYYQEQGMTASSARGVSRPQPPQQQQLAGTASSSARRPMPPDPYLLKLARTTREFPHGDKQQQQQQQQQQQRSSSGRTPPRTAPIQPQQGRLTSSTTTTTSVTQQQQTVQPGQGRNSPGESAGTHIVVEGNDIYVLQ